MEYKGHVKVRIVPERAKQEHQFLIITMRLETVVGLLIICFLFSIRRLFNINDRNN